MKKHYQLKSITPSAPDVEFAFNTKTGRVSGKNASEIQFLIEAAIKDGGVPMMPCYAFPIKGKITERKLAIILHEWYEIDGILPPINLTEEEVYGKDWKDIPQEMKNQILF